MKKMIIYNGQSAEKRARYCSAILYALRFYGGKAARRQVQNFIKLIFAIPESEQKTMLKSGMSKVDKDIDIAKHTLKLYRFVYGLGERGCKRGEWIATSKGMRADLKNLDWKSLINQLSIKGYRGNYHILNMVKKK